MKLSVVATTLMVLFINCATATAGLVDGGAVPADVAAAPVAATVKEDMTGAVSGEKQPKNHRGRGLGKKAEGKDPGYDGYNCKLCPDDDY